jgi:alkane 1-monooxygenase
LKFLLCVTWASEKARLAKKRAGALTLDNEVLQPALITSVLYVGSIVALSWIIRFFLLLQALWGWFGILTSANYVEHQVAK